MISSAGLATLGPDGVAHESELTAEELIARGEKLLQLGRDLQVQAARLRGEKPPEPERPPAGAERSVGRAGLVIEQTALSKARELETFTRLEFEDALGLDGAGTSKWLARLYELQAIVRGVREDGATVYRYARELEDEEPAYQLRQWCFSHRDPFDLEMAADGTGLSEEDTESAISELVAESVLAPVTIEATDDLGEIDKLGGAFYQYVPPIPGGVQGELERRRLASVNATPQVQRGKPVRIRTERRNAQARSTPGSRQKVINQDRNWERLQAAQAERAERDRIRAAQEAGKPKGRKAKRSRPV